MVSIVAAAASGAASNQQTVFRSITDLVVVDVSVERGQRTVVGLTSSDFHLIDNGVPQTVQLVASSSLPLDVTLVLDVSGSVGKNADRFWASVRDTAGLLRAGDRLALTTFSASINDVMPLTAVPVQLPAQPSVTMGTTLVTDALVHALMQPAPSVRRQIVVMFTDGDERSSVTGPERLVEVAKRCGAIVYIVLSRGNTFLKPALTDVSRLTGGAILNSSNVAEAFKKILDRLQQSYLLTYAPEGVPRPGWHTINVDVVKAGSYQVRARRGYWGG